MPTVLSPTHDLNAKPCILLVDDSAEEQRKLREVLRPYYRTSVALNGQQGYQQALAERPDLILLDVCMPQTDGHAACRLLKANPLTRDIPVIFLTSACSPKERVEGLLLGSVDYIAKPFVAEEVLARVRIHLDLSKRANAAGPVPAAAPQHNPDEVIVTAAKGLIAQHLQSPLTLEEVAVRIGTYEKKLSQIFRAQTGLTVFAYIREERIRRACQLLAETDLSMLDIADQIGFQNAANFSTAFRERVGMTPSTYRQSMQKGTHAE
ncbi:MAG TPA: DNA-binding response regulator [Gallionella sp.]|nr:DNA-binding response regulator [Gallionella sp.]